MTSTLGVEENRTIVNPFHGLSSTTETRRHSRPVPDPCQDCCLQLLDSGIRKISKGGIGVMRSLGVGRF